MDEPQAMRPRDLPAVLELERLCFATPWSREALEGELASAAARYFVIRRERRAVAYAGYWWALDEGYITNVAVHPVFRRQGLGRRLMAGLLADAAERGVRRMTLEVRAGNAAAQALYRQCGFAPCGVRRGYYPDNGEDAWVMLWEEKTD